jgi:hypothetical protein
VPSWKASASERYIRQLCHEALKEEIEIFKPDAVLSFTSFVKNADNLLEFCYADDSEALREAKRRPPFVLRAFHPAARGKHTAGKKYKLFEDSLNSNRSSLKSKGADVDELVKRWKQHFSALA